MNENKITAEDMIQSLTGFDEIAIAKHFGHEWGALIETSPVTFTRALVFVQKRRDGENDPDAKNSALSLTLKQVNDFFAEDDPELNPDEPETASGEGDSLPE